LARTPANIAKRQIHFIILKVRRISRDVYSHLFYPQKME
jgi:hypothetical protein